MHQTVRREEGGNHSRLVLAAGAVQRRARGKGLQASALARAELSKSVQLRASRAASVEVKATTHATRTAP